MPLPREIERVIVAVLDGLRPDAIPLYNLRHIDRLSQQGASTFAATTVEPSVTAAAMTSLLTGTAPQIHGLTSERFHIPKPRGPLDPLPQLLGRHGLPSTACLAALPRAYRGLGERIAARLGFTATRFVGDSAAEILTAGRDAIHRQRRGLILFHWPDADRAGHAHGWMSSEYGVAARRLDSALGLLAAMADTRTDRSTVLIALADHGGGGVCRTHHDSAHRHDRTIPIIVVGAAVRPGSLAPATSLLDVPATVAWALRVTPPPSYTGRLLTEAFAARRESAVAGLAATCA
jgi:predicted AlkP superfamily pyrophosphatase or phosphodiesterase